MLANNLCVFGDQDVKVPAHLNFGKFILDRLRRKKEEIALVSQFDILFLKISFSIDFIKIQRYVFI